jgi:hypothetical protein
MACGDIRGDFIHEFTGSLELSTGGIHALQL